MEALRYATDVATKESSSLREQSRHLESELATLRTEHVTLTQTQALDLGGSKKKIDVLEGELTRVRDELASREKQLIAAQQEKAQLRAEIESSGTSLVGELAQARAHIADLERELATIRIQGDSPAESELEIEALRQQVASLEREVADSAAENRRLTREIGNLSGQHSSLATAESSDASEIAELRANWQASEESRLELARRLEAEHEQSEQRLLAMRQQLESERSQMKQLVMQAAAEHDRTRAEMESLRSQLLSGSPGGEELDYFRARVQELESALLEGGGAVSGPADLEQYEQQLEQYRADLEQAQAELAQREQELETERQNVQEKLRQTELELSRERASFAREKAELDRMRREFLSEVEHAERESSARAKLAPLDRLASEVKGRVKESGIAVPQTPTFSDRLRNLIKRASDNPSKPDQNG
jgi:predicted  nucleic acid-binding Zn-ribbon protein